MWNANKYILWQHIVQLFLQDTENGQIIHYQLHDQYGQILQQDPGQTQVRAYAQIVENAYQLRII